MKKYVLGFVLGALIFSSGIVIAAELNVVPNPFPVLVNGVKTEVEGYNINGYTFLKLADLRKTGLTVIFNETEKRIEITSVNNSVNKEENYKGVDNMSTDLIEKTPDGLPIEYIDGKKYVDPDKMFYKYREITRYNNYVYIISTRDGTVWKLVKNEKNGNETVILDSVYLEQFDGDYKMPYDYYVETIMPLINN